jgi:probable addiction module antidote protein
MSPQKTGLVIDIDDIQIGERHRALSEDAVDRLMTSLQDIGLCQPITVRITNTPSADGETGPDVPILVAGAHRLEAAKRLGWSQVPCITMPDDQVAAELWEISENLHRHDLTKRQRDEHIRRYAELIEAKEVSPHDAAQPRSGPKGGRPKGVARQIAEATGLSDDTVRRALSPKPAKPLLAQEPETIPVPEPKAQAEFFPPMTEPTPNTPADEVMAAEVHHHDETLADLASAFETGDPAAIRAAIGRAVRAKGMVQVSKEAGIVRSALYQALSEKGNPLFTTVATILGTLGFRLAVVPKAVHAMGGK